MVLMLVLYVQVDQLFSILTTEFKSEIRSPDHLLDKIKNSSICPKPIVKELLYIWDWKEYITDKLSGTKLQNHSFFHSFMFKLENGIAVMRAKKYPQHREWEPSSGIQLIRSDQVFDTVPVSEFRIEKLNLDKVFADLYVKYFPTVDPQHRRETEASWERIRCKLEGLPRREKSFPKMILQKLPRQVDYLAPITPEYLEPLLNREERELVGERIVEEPEDGNFDNDLSVGVDVAIYSVSKAKRPWVGRVLKLLGNREFEIRWYHRAQRSKQYIPSTNRDGSPMSSKLSVDTVMMWGFTEKNMDGSFCISKQWLDRIAKCYEDHDMCEI